MNIDGDNLDTESNDHCKDEDDSEVEKLRGRQSIMAWYQWSRTLTETLRAFLANHDPDDDDDDGDGDSDCNGDGNAIFQMMRTTMVLFKLQKAQ